MLSPRDGRSRREIVAALRGQLGEWESQVRRGGTDLLSLGSPLLDGLLPEGGVRPGGLVEWLAAVEGGGATTLAVMMAREACRQAGALVVIDVGGEFYPPAAAAAGLDLDRTILVRPRNEADAVWAFDQALRCGGVAAALAWPRRLSTRAFRRLQLAAAGAGGLGLLVRPESCRDSPSWADARLLVRPLPGRAGRRLRVEALRCRGGEGRAIEVEIDDETGALRLVPPLAAAAPGRRAAGTS